MRAVAIKSFGGPEAGEVLDLEARDPGPGEARVRVRFAGVNAIDGHLSRGNYLGARQPDRPVVLGFEGAGEVDAVGSDVAGLKVGDRVAWCGVPGAMAEFAIVPVWRLVPMPDDMPLDIACAAQLDGTLAHALTMSAFPVKAGDWLLVQGGEDPASQMLVQIAHAQGANVVATVADGAAGDTLRQAGAAHVLAWGAESHLPDAIRDVTGGRYCNAVYDGVGQATLEASIASCRRRGVVILHGALSGPVASVNPDTLAAAGSIYLTRLHLPDFMQDATEVRWRTNDVIGAWQAGRLKISVSRIVTLDTVKDAMIALESSRPLGKVLVKM